jgi:hypothetical protein
MAQSCAEHVGPLEAGDVRPSTRTQRSSVVVRMAGGPVGKETAMVEDDYGPWDD